MPACSWEFLGRDIDASCRKSSILFGHILNWKTIAFECKMSKRVWLIVYSHGTAMTVSVIMVRGVEGFINELKFIGFNPIKFFLVALDGCIC